MKSQRYYSQVIEILQEKVCTRNQLAKELKISMPTTLQVVNDLLEKDVILEEDSSESTGGRKAKYLSLNAQAAYTLGISINLHHIRLGLVDYKGEILHDQREELAFEDKPNWYECLKSVATDFLQKYGIKEDELLCVGISFPGIINDVNRWILHSHIFHLHNISLDRFEKMFSVPVEVFNDANCGGYAELHSYGDSYLYLSLNESVGGAIIIHGQLYQGQSFHAGEIGHMILVPGGRQCYCGKIGCADPYLKVSNLVDEDRDIYRFDEKLKSGDKEALEKWNQYLECLAIFITNLRMLLDMDIIVGGEVGKIIDSYLPDLVKKMVPYDLFARDIDYVYASKVKKCANAIGAARLALAKYRDKIIQQD